MHTYKWRKLIWRFQMKILFVFYVPSGGVETLNRHRGKALKSAGIESHFLYYSNPRNMINEHAGPVYITNDDIEIQRIITEHAFDSIVIVSDFDALYRFNKLGYKGKMLIEIQGYGARENARKSFLAGKDAVESHCTALMNPKTPHIAELFKEIFPRTQSYSFNNCFDADSFAYNAGITEQTPIIGWIGRLEDNKNWREFLQICARLNAVFHQQFRYHLYEDPSLSTASERAAFQMMIKQLKLEEHLHIYQNIPNEEMKDHFSQIGNSGGFLCSTSKVEGAPYAILEALSCKCPILTTDSDGVRSAIIHNYTGKYYRIGNITHAVKEARELLQNQQLREQIRTNGHKHVRENFSYDAYAANFKAMLNRLNL